MSQDVIHGLYASYGEFDISGEFVGADLGFGGQVLEAVPWNASLVQHNGGIPDGSASLQGVMTSAQPIQRIIADVAATHPWGFVFEMTTYADTPAENDFCMFGQGPVPGPTWTAQNGSLSSWTLDIAGLPIFGWLLAYGTKTSTGTSAAGKQIGALAAGESMYSLLVVDTATSGTIDVVVQSDDNSGFTSASARITHTQVTTTASAELLIYTPAAGQTDDWWRSSWTSASTPSHKIAHMVGKF